MTPAFRPRHRPWRWVALWVLLIALVAAGSLMPARDLPTPPIAGLDKLQHLVGYGALSAYAAMLFGPARLRIGAALALVAYGIGIEFAQQALTTSREADAIDVLANTLGVAVGQLIAFTPMSRCIAAVDARMHG